RHGNERDVLATDALWKALEHGSNGTPEADGQIPVRGERFGACDDTPLTVERHGVRVGATRVEPDPDLGRRTLYLHSAQACGHQRDPNLSRRRAVAKSRNRRVFAASAPRPAWSR